MITAAISLISGLVSGSAPTLIKEWTAGREHERELASLERQANLQIKLADKNIKGKLAEMDREKDIAAMNNATQLTLLEGKIETVAYDTMAAIAKASMKPTGITWVDAWNAALRPFAVTIIISLFAVMASCYTYSVLTTVTDMQLAVKLLWGSLVGESIQAVLGFLFGYRSAKKLSK